jgi:hypothetical protein
MRKLLILLFVVVVSLSAYAINKDKEPAKESGTVSFQPKPLDDEWSKWAVGKWELTKGQSDFLGADLEDLRESNKKVTAESTVKLGLNGQFLIVEGHSNINEMTDEQKKQTKESLKKITKASDEVLERYLSMPYESLEIYTIDQKTGEVIGYVFESQRCTAQGRGKRQGNKEIIEWVWTSGAAKGTTSISTTEKISNDKATCTNEYILPNGQKIEEKLEMTRKK